MTVTVTVSVERADTPGARAPLPRDAAAPPHPAHASPPPVERMSAASYTSLNENAMQYIGIAFKSGCRPYVASSAAACSSASGCFRKSSQAFGQLAGSGQRLHGTSQLQAG